MNSKSLFSALLIISAFLLAPLIADAEDAYKSCGDCDNMTCDVGSGQYVACSGGKCRCFDGVTGAQKDNAFQNCNTDAQCNTGNLSCDGGAIRCKNLKCQCNLIPNFCAKEDSCDVRFPGTTAFNGNKCPGDYCVDNRNFLPGKHKIKCYTNHLGTDHIHDCRGISSNPHDRGGVMSYCSRCGTCDGSGSTCYSGYNSCFLRWKGTLSCTITFQYKEYDEDTDTTWEYYGPGRNAQESCSVGSTPPPESSCNATPVGSFDGLTCEAGAFGTAQDPDAPGAAVPIYLYDADPRPGFGIAPIATVYTDPETQQFAWALPPTYFDNGSHTIYAFAQNLALGGGSAGGTPVALTNISRTVTGCAAYPSGTATVTCNAPAQTVVTGTASDPQGESVPIQIWDTTKSALMTTANAEPEFTANSPAFADGIAHTVHVYAVDIPTNALQLIGSHTCIPPPTATINAVVDPSYCSGGPTMEINWQYDSVGSQMSAFQIRVLGTSFDTGKQLRDGTPTPPYTTTGKALVGPGILGYDTPYTIELTVWDKSDLKSQAVTLTHATLGGPWVVASFSFVPSQPAAGIPITFSAINVGDPDEYPTDAQWDFNNDGTWDAAGLTVEHTYDTALPGVTVRMQARNDIMPDGAYCAAEDVIFGVQQAIPGYREVRPGTQPSSTPRPSVVPAP